MFQILVVTWCRFIIDGEQILSVPDPPVDQNPDWVDFFTFGSPWEIGDPDWNPWEGSTNLAPFDREVT